MLLTQIIKIQAAMTAKGNLDFVSLSFFVVITDKSHQKGIKILNEDISGKYLIFVFILFLC
jgi:hypothetical protein